MVISPNLRTGATVSKFIMSLGDNAYQVLQLEAARRYISIQELLRAVIIPEWVEQNPPPQKALAQRLALALVRHDRPVLPQINAH